MNFKPLRLAVVLLGDRLAVAALSGTRLEAFTVDVENPAAALRAELDARRLPARSAFLALSRNAVTVKPIDLPPVAGDVRQMVGFELERHLPFPAENASYDFVALPRDPATERPPTPEQRVLITAADQRVVDVALRLAEDARLRPLSLTVAAHNLPTLARLRRGVGLGRRRRAARAHRGGALRAGCPGDGAGVDAARPAPDRGSRRRASRRPRARGGRRRRPRRAPARAAADGRTAAPPHARTGVHGRHGRGHGRARRRRAPGPGLA